MSKFEMKIDFSDIFIMDEDGDETTIKDEVVRRICYQVASEIKSRLGSDFYKIATEKGRKISEIAVSRHLSRLINAKLSEPQFKIDTRYSSKKQTINEVIAEKVQEYCEKYKFEDLLHKFVKEEMEKVAQRYDMLFAASVVKSLNDQKLLKDEAIVKLLNNKTE